MRSVLAVAGTAVLAVLPLFAQPGQPPAASSPMATSSTTMSSSAAVGGTSVKVTVASRSPASNPARRSCLARSRCCAP